MARSDRFTYQRDRSDQIRTLPEEPMACVIDNPTKNPPFYSNIVAAPGSSREIKGITLTGTVAGACSEVRVDIYGAGNLAVSIYTGYCSRAQRAMDPSRGFREQPCPVAGMRHTILPWFNVHPTVDCYGAVPLPADAQQRGSQCNYFLNSLPTPGLLFFVILQLQLFYFLFCDREHCRNSGSTRSVYDPEHSDHPARPDVLLQY